ncbi:hypothetical protein [Streptomyces flaveolus]|uniref:hypothetical protein n=1 Tax=Streptomyces flaveolus TaxID=67297 RepID=UPI0036FC0CFB
MTTTQECGTEMEPVEVINAELVDGDAPGADEVAVHDAVVSPPLLAVGYGAPQ